MIGGPLKMVGLKNRKENEKNRRNCPPDSLVPQCLSSLKQIGWFVSKATNSGTVHQSSLGVFACGGSR